MVLVIFSVFIPCTVLILMKFSIIIPTCDRPDRLDHCLVSLSKLEFPTENFEVVVVDDGSQEPLDTVVGEFDDQLNISLLRTSNQGPAAARNTGAEHAKGEFLAFTDDDCEADENWLNRLDDVFTEFGECMIGGRTINRLTKNYFSMSSQFIVDLAYSFYNRDCKNAKFFASNNMALTAHLYKKLGGFDADFRIASEDRDLCDRCRFERNRLVYEPEAVIWHSHSLSFLRFWRQHFRYGRGAARFHRVRASRGSGRIFHDFSFHLFFPQLFLDRCREMKWTDCVVLIPILLVWQFANALGFGFEFVAGDRVK